MSAGEQRRKKGEAGFLEFIILMASLTSTVAMSIDMVLPALGLMQIDFALTGTNTSQLVVVFLFAGFSTGQFIHGPISDATGRKTIVYAGSAITLVGTLMCLISTNFTMMLAGRFLQGLGVAAARTMVTAIIRDKFDGNKLAQVISIVMAVFIIVPALAPAVGQLIISISHWRYLFAFFLLVVLLNTGWFFLRQPETLKTQFRYRLSASNMLRSCADFCSNRFSMGYSLICGLVFGAFFGYLNSARQIFQNIYQLNANQFVLSFAALALGVGIGSLANARLVMIFGTRRITFWALLISTTAALTFLGILIQHNLVLSFPLYMTFCAITFTCMGITFGNINALALEPMKHIAGMASALIGGLSGFIAAGFGALVGQMYNHSLLPLISGFVVSGVASLLLMYLIEKYPYGRQDSIL